MATCKETTLENNPEIGKTAIVTGSSSGIGFACIESLLENGVKNVVMSSVVDSQNVKQQIQDLEAKFEDSTICYIQCDVSSLECMQSLFEVTVEKFGCLDILVNNAGIFNEPDWSKTIDVNLKGAITGTQLAIKQMSKENGGQGGTIINVASVLGFAPMAAAPVYVATKHAMIGYTRSMALPFHYEKSGVRIMALCPGLTETTLVEEGKKIVNSDKTNPMIEEWYREISACPAQPATYPSRCLIKMLTEGENGSIWVAENEEIYEINFPDYKSLVKKNNDGLGKSTKYQ